jgi:glucokinase
MFQFPVLLGDIGGTNARFAVLPSPHAPVISLPRTLTALHATPSEAMTAVLQGQTCPEPRSALVAVATRVDDSVVRLTNAPWVIDAARICADLGLSRVVLVNDYVPMAVSLSALQPDRADLARIGPELPMSTGVKLVLGPGTGLGAAALLSVGSRLAVQPMEAAHVDFGPSNEAEMALWPGIERVGGRITAETVLSGPGLLRLYRACAHLRGRAAVLSSPEAVTRAALTGADGLATETLRLFVRLLGRFAGDLALIFGATGGLFLGSGIAPTIIPFLDTPDFRGSFEDKEPFAALLGRIPSFVIMHPEPAITGLARIASNPCGFILESHGWVS